MERPRPPRRSKRVWSIIADSGKTQADVGVRSVSTLQEVAGVTSGGTVRSGSFLCTTAQPPDSAFNRAEVATEDLVWEVNLVQCTALDAIRQRVLEQSCAQVVALDSPTQHPQRTTEPPVKCPKCHIWLPPRTTVCTNCWSKTGSLARLDEFGKAMTTCGSCGCLTFGAL